MTRVWMRAAALVAAGTLSFASGAAPLGGADRERIAVAIASYMQRSGTPAVSVVVDRAGTTVYRADVGVADVEHAHAARPESVYAIGSITKAFTAHAVLSLVAAGRLSLDATVGSVLPEYTGAGRDVTVAQLLDHTNGIPNYVSEVPGLARKLQRTEMSREQMVATFAGLPLSFAPGTRWRYTNSGYYLLGLIVEKVSGRSYYDYLRDDVLKPLGITRVWSGDDREIVPNRVRGYQVGRTGLENAPPWAHLVPFSAGSLLSTADEVARYRRAVFTSPAVPPKLRELILADRPLASGEVTGYLLGGLVRTQFGGATKLAHSGEIWGYSASHAYYPESDTTIVVLSNCKGPLLSPVSLERQIARVVLRHDAPEVTPGPLPHATLARYAGEYRFTKMQIGPPLLNFVAKDGQLYVGYEVGVDAAKMLPLLPAGPDRFVLAPDQETAFEFSGAGPDGRTTRVEMDALNGRLPASRALN